MPNAASFAQRLTRARWSGWDLPAHLTHFTSETLRWAVARAGLEPVELYPASVGTLANHYSWTSGAVGRSAVFALDQLLDPPRRRRLHRPVRPGVADLTIPTLDPSTTRPAGSDQSVNMETASGRSVRNLDDRT